MPRLNAPLLSLTARGKVGGERKVPKGRLRFYVKDFPTAEPSSTTAAIVMAAHTIVRLQRFYLPFHLTVRSIVLYVNSGTGVGKLRAGLYNELGSLKLGEGITAGMPTAAGFYSIPMNAPVVLVPGCYYLGFCTDRVNSSISTSGKTLDFNSPYDRLTSGSLPMYHGAITQPVAGELPATFNPVGMTAGGNVTTYARLLDS